MRNSRGLCVIAAVAALALLGVPASAAPPKPEPCDGKLLITDPAGDQAVAQQGVPLFATPDNTDVRGLFFRIDGDKVTANIVISDLSTTPMAPFSAIRYRAYGTVGGNVHYFQALVTSSGATFTYGGDFQGVSYTEQGTTTGTLFEGKEGIVQIVIPPNVGGKPGSKLLATSATAGLLTVAVPPEVMLPPFYFQADTAPDASADGPTTTVEACAAPGAAGPTTSTPGALATVTVNSNVGSAKKASKKHSVSLSLKSSEALTSVTGKLKRGA
ncbi:MAG: hypothetical protein QOI98_200, partial [Solirubrobacteraceae bacterium]|nr:hypothetical protein [Solirubrobacteraceae bacterium]